MKRILVAGDVMLDGYLVGAADRISPEAPIPIVKLKKEEYRLGGAANVALNVAGAGASCTLMGIIGTDQAAQRISEILKASDIKDKLVECENQTIVKTRVMAGGQQIVRLDQEDKFSNKNIDLFTQEFIIHAKDYDAVIFSDYNKGTLAKISSLIEHCNKVGIPTFVDPKVADISVYQGSTVLTPNLKEFQSSVQYNQDLDLDTNIHNFSQLGICEHLIVTKGNQGVQYVQAKTSNIQYYPTLSVEVTDVTGAGDTFIAYCAVERLSSDDLHIAIQKAVIAATYAVTKSGTHPVNINDLEFKKDVILSEQYDIINHILRTQREQKKRIGFTNGCFDVLHAGHLDYLRKARGLCDYLIVGLNSDASVKLLKGAERPHTKMQHRAENLLALNAVDLVVIFDELTPLKIIKMIDPNVLVKGGDYIKEDIVGYKHVSGRGGEIHIIDFLYDISTTKLLDIMQ